MLAERLARRCGRPGEDIEVDRFIVDRPVSWNDIADYLGTKPAQRSHQLARGSEIFAEVRGRIEYTSRALTPLTPGDHHNSAVWTAALLRQKSDQLLCAACNEPMHPADAITNPSLSWDAQFYEGDKPTSCDLGAAGDAVALVCPACDHVLHGPATFEDLARRLRPACPSCLLRENVAPLRSEGTSEASEGHVCQVRSSASRRAQWHCAACSRDFRVSDAAGALPGNRAEVPPRRQRDRGLYTAEGIARALGRNLEPGDEVPRAIGNLLTGYADWDVWVEDTPEEELEIGIGNIGVGLDYPVTLDRLFSAVDDLSELASEQAEAQLNEGD